jgi:hypothetical protein
MKLRQKLGDTDVMMCLLLCAMWLSLIYIIHNQFQSLQKELLQAQGQDTRRLLRMQEQSALDFGQLDGRMWQLEQHFQQQPSSIQYVR